MKRLILSVFLTLIFAIFLPAPVLAAPCPSQDAAILQRFDANRNNVIDDQEVTNATNAWTTGSPGAPTDRQIVAITNAWTTGCQVKAAGPTATASDIKPLASGAKSPQDLDGDGLFEDLNADNAFTEADCDLFFKHLAKELKLTDTRFDFNRDGKVNAADAPACRETLGSGGGVKTQNNDVLFVARSTPAGAFRVETLTSTGLGGQSTGNNGTIRMLAIGHTGVLDLILTTDGTCPGSASGKAEVIRNGTIVNTVYQVDADHQRFSSIAVELGDQVRVWAGHNYAMRCTTDAVIAATLKYPMDSRLPSLYVGAHGSADPDGGIVLELNQSPADLFSSCTVTTDGAEHEDVKPRPLPSTYLTYPKYGSTPGVIHATYVCQTAAGKSYSLIQTVRTAAVPTPNNGAASGQEQGGVQAQDVGGTFRPFYINMFTDTFRNDPTTVQLRVKQQLPSNVDHCLVLL